MTDFFDHYLKRGKWDSKQAALIFNRKDPRLHEKKIVFPADDNDYSRVKPDTWQWKALDYYYIFETAGRSDWERCGADLSSPYFWFHTYKEASPSVFITLAQDKLLEIPEELLKIHGEKIPHVREPEDAQDKTIYERRVEVLKGWLANNNPKGAPLDETQQQMWDELSSINSNAFLPKSSHTIADFFKAQNLCAFKRGRRKGGN